MTFLSGSSWEIRRERLGCGGEKEKVTEKEGEREERVGEELDFVLIGPLGECNGA